MLEIDSVRELAKKTSLPPSESNEVEKKLRFTEHKLYIKSSEIEQAFLEK